MTEISVKDLDSLLELLKEKRAEKEAIEETLTLKNKEITSLEFRATEVLKSLDRDEYAGPATIFEKLEFKPAKK
jgi:hypothetical protein